MTKYVFKSQTCLGVENGFMEQIVQNVVSTTEMPFNSSERQHVKILSDNTTKTWLFPTSQFPFSLAIC